jgi:putative oxidoreductase
MLGLFTRISAAVNCVELAAAYIVASAPHGFWPIHNGGNETLMYLAVFVFLAVCGGGALSIDALIVAKNRVQAYSASAARSH